MNQKHPQRPNDPLRSPTWRWDRALAARIDLDADQASRAARRFDRGWRECRTDLDRQRLRERMPSLFTAHDIFCERLGQLRPALEARILAGQDAPTIAARTGLPLGVIAAYEATFYDVRDRLMASDFVHQRLIGPPEHWGATGAWRYFAYRGGPIVLDALLGNPSDRPTQIGQVSGFVQGITETSIQFQIAAIMQSAPDRATQLALTRSAATLVRPLDAEAPARRDALEVHIQAMVDEITWVSGADADRPGMLPPAIAAADTCPGELRDDELQRLNHGESIPGLMDELKMPFPPPRKARVPILMGGVAEAPTPTVVPSKPAAAQSSPAPAKAPAATAQKPVPASPPAAPPRPTPRSQG